jgi:peptidoglycan hydrolase-like protein with peptidoglycan-binding domain
VPARSTAQPKDQIGALLGGLVDDAVDPSRVMAVQKALVKLGYVVKPDGVMGSGTRQALQMFEQSRKLTVTGELTPRTLRELGTQSGVAIP